MGRRRRGPAVEVEVEIRTLGPKGVGLGTSADGALVAVRPAPPGSRVLVRAAGRRKKGVLRARRLAMVRPPARGAVPPCPVFGLCGGCVLQELDPAAQRRVRYRFARAEVERGFGDALPPRARWHGIRAASAPYGYRNRVELTFGPTRYLTDAEVVAGADRGGRFLGFHAPGRFDRIVDTDACALAHPAMNAVIAAVRSVALSPDAPAPYGPRTHDGFWRHLLVRHAVATGELLVVLFTTSPGEGEAVWARRCLQAIAAAPLPAGASVAGASWAINDGVADVARGEVAEALGRDWIRERFGAVEFRVSRTSFLQTSSAGAVVLYDTVREALGTPPADATLYDLYCGAGSIGLYLAGDFARVVGIEEVEAAVHDARANAGANGIEHVDFRAARVEDALDAVPEREAAPRVLVVDPPRAGLHPRAARHLAGVRAECLVYVACGPASLGRDAAVLEAGGWRLTDLWAVDLFPQTGHVEVVARFERAPSASGVD